MRKESKWKISIYIISIIASLIYIIYRILYTIPSINIIDIILGIAILIIEIIDALFFCFYIFNILIYNKDTPKVPKVNKKQYPDVDIFIATINESTELLRKTINSTKRMNYPNKNKVHIYVCDDGNRKNIKKLCKELEVNYITRTNNLNAKSGNYNNALSKTSSKYIATFDADMCPNKNFLMKTIPFFIKNNKIGFVQLPQSFFNPDLFQSKFKLENSIPLEQDYFYHKIQMSKNKTNSVICCGTNVVYNREALEKIGGFATKSITEDIATGMLIEQNGYTSVAISDDEVYGLNVTSIDSLIKQRSRWCRGCIQLFKNYKILRNKKLTISQKIGYISAIYYWSFGIRTMIYLIVPLLFSIFNIRVIQANIIIFSIIFFSQYILKRFIIDLIENNQVSSTWNRIYEISLAPIIAKQTLKEFLGFGSNKFEVTSKRKNNKNITKKTLELYLSHLILFILTLIGIMFSIYKCINLGIKIYIIPLFWLINNLIYLTIALIFDCSNKEEKESLNEIKKYKKSSAILLFINFIKHEIKLKESILIGIIIIFVVTMYPKSFEKVYYSENINRNSVSYNGYLKIKDGELVNKNNEIVHLRGVSTHNLYYYGKLYNQKNISTLVKTWNINVFRIAIYTNPSDEGIIKNKNIKQNIEKIIEACIKEDIYVIIDWHILEDNNPQIYEEESIKFFDEISKKYGKKPNIIYEICNEPNGETTWIKNIKPYAENIIKVIKRNTNKPLILVGTPNWSKDIDPIIKSPLSYENTMYVLHSYSENNLDIIKLGIDKAKKAKIPIIITECSLTDSTGDGKIYEDVFKKWINHLEKNNISWIVWQLSDKFESSSLLLPKEVKWKQLMEKEKITEEELKKKKYNINDYLSKTGVIVKKIIRKYTINKKEK